MGSLRGGSGRTQHPISDSFSFERRGGLKSRRRMERENLVPCFEKKLSKTDATGNLEIPMNALHLPAVDNEIMNVRYRNERIWEFKAPARRDGSGRRYMTCQWRQFVRENDLEDGDTVKFSWSTADEHYHVVTVKKIRTLQLFPGAPL